MNDIFEETANRLSKAMEEGPRRSMECQIRGCLHLETRCKDCGRLVSSVDFERQFYDGEIPPYKFNMIREAIEQDKAQKRDWISVKDRLPEEQEECLTRNEEPGNNAHWHEVYPCVYDKNLNVFKLIGYGDRNGQELPTVTHWARGEKK